MLPAHVGPHVRRVLRPERTVRAVETRRLTARVLEMVLEIVTPIEGSAALRADVHLLRRRSLLVDLTDRVTHAVPM